MYKIQNKTVFNKNDEHPTNYINYCIIHKYVKCFKINQQIAIKKIPDLDSSMDWKDKLVGWKTDDCCNLTLLTIPLFTAFFSCFVLVDISLKHLC